MLEKFIHLSKSDIHKALIAALDDQYEQAVAAAHDARSHATHDENVAEHKYDTLGLEASYLAEGQSKRALDLYDSRESLSKLILRSFNDEQPLKLSALVLLKTLETTDYSIVFIAPSAGGLLLNFRDIEVRVVTPASPLGKSLIGAYEGDDVVVNMGNQHARYEIVSVL